MSAPSTIPSAKPDVTTLVKFDWQGKRTEEVIRLGAELGDFGGRFISGVSIANNAQSSSVVRIDTDWANVYEDQDRAFGTGPGDPTVITGDDPIWRLYGNDVNHLTAVFFAYRRAKLALA
jgi:hypothetical protein